MPNTISPARLLDPSLQVLSRKASLFRRMCRAAVLAAAFLPSGAAALEIEEDSRVDLVGVVQFLAGDRKLEGAALAALDRFKPLRGHAAVRRLKSMPRFRGHIPVQYSVYLSSDLVGEAFPSPDFFADAAGGREALTAFRAELADFARESGFPRWREDRPELFIAPRDELRRRLAETDLETALVQYLGWRSWERWIVVVSPFHEPEAAWIVEEKKGLPLVYAFVPPEWRGKEPTFEPFPDLSETIWMEAAYTAAYFISEMCRPHLDSVRDCARRSVPESCVQRFIVEAVIARLSGLTATPPRLASAMALFESRRDERKDLVSWREELLTALGAPAPSCPLSQPERLQEKLFSRRVAWYPAGNLVK